MQNLVYNLHHQYNHPDTSSNNMFLKRYLMVCHAQAMVGRQKCIGRQIVKISIFTSIGFGLASFINRRNTHTFLTCMGRMELFVFDLRNPFNSLIGGDNIKLPFSNPFRLCIYVVGYAFILVVPCCYYKIF